MENKQTNTPANMGKRILSASLILVGLVLFIFVRQISESTKYVFDILIGFLMILGTFEIENILKKMDRPVYSIWLGIYPSLCFLAILLGTILKISFIGFLLIVVLSMVAIFLITFLYGVISKKTTLKQMYLDGFEGSRINYALQKSLNTILVCIYPTFLLCFLFLINHFEMFTNKEFSADVGLMGILLLFTTTMLADTFAMLSGRLIKSKKINLEKLGPGKSWSGFVGGIIGAVIGSVVLYFILNSVGYSQLFADYNLPFWKFLILGIFCGLVNMMGDIISSFIKRRAGVKDFGNIIPGHGGVMDRINGLVFNVLVVFVFIAVVFMV